jgi:hypothetical protein
MNDTVSQDAAIGEDNRVSRDMENAGVSVPDAEELKTGVLPWSRRRRYLWPVLCSVVVLLAIVLGVTLGVSHHQSNGTDRGVLPSFTHTKKAGRNADLDRVIALLKDVTNDSGLLDDQTSPQFQAATWLAEQDEANLAVPDGVDADESYIYLFRYVMALNYFAMGGTDWSQRDRLNFLSSRHVCDWNGVHESVYSTPDQLAPGIRCSDGTNLPVGVYLRKKCIMQYRQKATSLFF